MAHEFDTDFFIVGSGFGGSVSALRLAEKSYRVWVAEQGQRFTPDKLPTSTWDVRRFLWLPQLACRGFFALRLFKHVLVLHGKAVGGGSVVYANTLLRPPATVWQTGSWAGLRPWAQEMPAHYRRAEAMLGVTENPVLAAADHTLHRLSTAAGVGDRFYRTQVAVYFGPDDRHARPPVNGDPYFDGAGPARSPCTACGGCMVGCRHGAKNSLDRNYLYLAEQRGVRLLAETTVTRIQPLGAADGRDGYRITVCRRGQAPQHHTARQVIVAAGCLGTLQLLFAMKQQGYLPAISDTLGHNVFTNAESLLALRFPGCTEDFSRGIAIGSGVYLADGTHIEATRFPAGSDIASLLGTLINHSRHGRIGFGRWLGALAHGWLTRPRQMWHAMRPKNMARESMILLCMRSMPQPLRMVWRRGWFGHRLATEGQPIPAYIPAASDFAVQAAEHEQGHAFTSAVDVWLNIPTTAHCMGGAALAGDPQQGVCDHQHRVFGYRNLYVVDGANIAANLGVNPSLTIAALAEAAMAAIPPKDTCT